MESQRFQPANFPASLDGWLEQIPDADARSALREVFVSAYREVEEERAEVTGLRAEAEEAKQSHQSQLQELEAERKALRDERAKLDATVPRPEESEQELRVRLNPATRDLEQAQPKLQQAEADARDLGIVTTQLNVVRATVDDLRDKLARAESVHHDCPAKLAEVHGKLGENLVHKHHLEQEHQKILTKLNHLQSQEAQGDQQRLQDQWATEKRELMAQLAELRSREAEGLNSQRERAWDAERQALHGQLADKSSLAEAEKRRADDLRTSLDTANVELADVKADVDALDDSMIEKGDLITSLEAQRDALSQAHPVLSVRQDEIGDIARLYLELADELYDMPARILDETRGDRLYVASRVLTHLARPNAKAALMYHLSGTPDTWHCFDSALGGNYHSLSDEGVCQTHIICVHVRHVLVDGVAVLQFIRSSPGDFE